MFADTSKALLKLIKGNADNSYFLEVLYYHLRKALIHENFDLRELDAFRISGKYLGYDIDVYLDRQYNNVVTSLSLALSLRALMLNNHYLKYVYDDKLLFYTISKKYLSWDCHRIIIDCLNDNDFSIIYNMILSYIDNNTLSNEHVEYFKKLTIDPGYRHQVEFCKILADRPDYNGKTVIKNNAFLYSDMDQYVVNSKVEYIGNTAFAYCENLKELTFEGKVLFGHFPIIECNNLRQIIVPSEFVDYYKQELPYYKDIISDTRNNLESINVSNGGNYPSFDDIYKLWHVFDKKATSYKYFWFLSILQCYKTNEQAAIEYKSILAKMIANAWKYVFNEECEFPKIDQISKYIGVIIAKVMLDDNSDEETVEGQILYYYERSHLDHILSPLLNNVPYRFLSPWIPFTSNEDVIVKSKEMELNCLYSLYDDHIVVNPIWRDYIKDNYDTLIKFAEQGLRTFLKL